MLFLSDFFNAQLSGLQVDQIHTVGNSIIILPQEFQILMYRKAPGKLGKLQIAGPHPQGLRFSESEVGAKSLRLNEPPRWVCDAVILKPNQETELVEPNANLKFDSPFWL